MNHVTLIKNMRSYTMNQEARTLVFEDTSNPYSSLYISYDVHDSFGVIYDYSTNEILCHNILIEARRRYDILRTYRTNLVLVELPIDYRHLMAINYILNYPNEPIAESLIRQTVHL